MSSPDDNNSPLPRLRTSEHKLYTSTYEQVTEGIRKLSLRDPRPGPDPNSSEINPDYSPSMNNRPQRFAPHRLRDYPAYGSQDARSGSNLAIEPSATPSPGSMSLKKSSVRIKASGSSSTPATSCNASGALAPPVATASKAEDGLKTPTPLPNPFPVPTVKVSGSSTPKQTEAQAELEAMFARLTSPPTNASTSLLSSRSQLSLSPEGLPSLGRLSSHGGLPALGGLSSPETAAATKKEPVKDVPVKAQGHATLDEPKKITVKSPASTDPKTLSREEANLSRQQLELVYLKKASEYLASFPSNVGPTGDLIKSVITKLCRPYTPSATLGADSIAQLKDKCVAALATYLEGINKGKKTVDKEEIGMIMTRGDGDFLYLCAVLAKQGLIDISNLDQVVGLSKALINVLPKDGASPSSTPASKPTSSAKGSTWRDPVDSMTSWPTREKRENAPRCRTVYLKNLHGIDSIHKLQALVWGGKIESLQLSSGSGSAVVRFITPEACQKYFDATENGISLPGSNEVVIVEKAAGPNSVNDVIRNVTDGDATRCVMAFDAEEGWSDMALMKLARGDNPKREVDRIKRGKTSKGRRFVEFRFANIYQALQFKRVLMEDEDWEPCLVTYAPDPCERVRGVHFKDEDEKATGGFF